MKLAYSLSSRISYTCPLCERNFEDNMSALIHLDSKMHKNSEEILKEVEEAYKENQ